jgi:outer membrane protein
MKRSMFAAVPMFVAVLALGGTSLEAQQAARGTAQAQQAQATRFAFINSQRILAEAPGTAEAHRAFEADMARFREELEKFETELETLQANYEKQQATLSAAVKQQRQQEMQQKFAAYQQRRSQLEETAQRRQAELVEPIMKRISETIEQIRKEGGYGMIFDASAGMLLAADPGLDLTDRVLATLRTSASR